MPKLLPFTEDGLAKATEILIGGNLVAFPTETVYGLGANALSDMAVAKIFATKQRPGFNPLIVHVADRLSAECLAHFDDRALALADMFWPGPISMVLPLKDGHGLSSKVTAGLPSVAIRCPAHPLARALLAKANLPLAAPSANRSGQLSPTSPLHVQQSLSGADLHILSGGRCEVGLESTIIDLTSDHAVLLRPGAISQDAIESIIGPVETSDGNPDAPSAPGQTLRHYAPRLPIRLEALSVQPGEALLGFGPGAKLAARGAKKVLNLSDTGDLNEAAGNLFAYLHDLDLPDEYSAIAVMPIPDQGIGVAMNDRLSRAAAAVELQD